MKSVPSAKPVKYGSTDSWTQTAAKLLTIGSEDADVWIYRVKMYGNSLNRYEILDNYIADCTDPEEMVARYLRNDIFDTEGKISISKLTARNTELRSVHIKAKRMTTGKDDEVTADIEIIYVAGGETHHLIATGITFKAQGTSSLEYILAALNLDIDFSTATSFTNGKGDAITSYAFTENSIPVDYFNLKADVASSESANNVVLCDEFNSYNPTPFAGKTGGVRDTIEGHPCAVFFTNTSDAAVSIGARSVAAGETVLYFAGNMNNSNTIWVNIFGLMYDELKRVYKENKDAWDAARIIKKFNDYQAITPEAVRIEDMWNKYFQPLLLANESAFLKRCHGTKEYWREQFETYQDVYFASKYCDTSDRANCISLRATVSNAAAGNIDITPYSDLYITVMYGTNGTVRIRAKRNVTYTVECPVDSLTDTETYIFAASNLTKLGDLSKLKTKFVTLTKAEKLQVLPIGCDEAGYKHFMSAERIGQFAGPYFGMYGLMNANRQMNNVNTNVGGFPAMTI